MRCAIFGAAGFVGRHLAEHLAREGASVLGLDVVPPPRPDEPLARFLDATEYRQVDATRDPIELPAALDAVFYLSQSPHYREYPRRGTDLFGVNLVGALAAREAAVQAGSRHFVHASTGSVYVPSFGPLAESAPVRRDNAYALSKIVAEEALSLAGSSPPITIVRPFGVFGPGQRGMLVPGLIDRVRSGRPIELERNPEDPADEDGLRISLLFVDDAVRALVAIASRDSTAADSPEIFNLAGPEGLALRRVAGAIQRTLGVSSPVALVDRERPGDLVADITALRRVHSAPFTPLDEAIARTVAADSA